MSDHLDIYRGDTPIIRVGPVRRPNGAGVLQPVNLAGATGKLTVRPSIDSVATTFQKTGVVVTLVDTNDGMEFALTAGDTSGLTPGAELLWDVQIAETGGTITTFPKNGPGTIRVLGDVTTP